MSTGYYRIESRRFSYREIARMVRGQSTPILMWILKTLGISWHSTWMRRPPENFRDSLVTGDQLTPAGRQALDAARPQLIELGFVPEGFYIESNSFYPLENAGEIYLHNSGRAVAKVFFVRNATIDHTSVTLLSRLADGKVIATTDRTLLTPSPNIAEQELHKAPPAKLWQAHEQRLAACAPPQIHTDRELMLDFFDAVEKAEWEWLIRRRVLVECTPDELEKAKARVTAVGGGETTDPNAAVLVEMAQAMERRGTWKQALWAFSITLALFIVAGILSWDITFMWMLVIALIVHELGHYITMRMFGYKNLRMIFVPLGGAAVIGHNYNVPGWKKAIVSLMGPLPGILVACVCAILAVVRGPSHIRDEVAIVALILNGLNLLPIYPLDGGAYLNAILFCRNAKLEAVFKTIAVIVLAVAAIGMRDFILGIFAYLIGMGLPNSFRFARYTEALRREIDIPCVDNPNELPLEIRTRVIDGVKTTLRKPANAKTVAAHALGIFERLNARPPGIVGTISLLAVYALTFALALGAFGAIFSAKTDGRNFARVTPNIVWSCPGPADPAIPRNPDRVSFWSIKAPTDKDAIDLENELQAYSAAADYLNAYAPWAVRDAEPHPDEKRARDTLLQLTRIEMTVSNEKLSRLVNDAERTPSAVTNWIWDVAEGVGRVASTNQNFDPMLVRWFTNRFASTRVSDSSAALPVDAEKRLGAAPETEDSGTDYLKVERDGRTLNVDVQFQNAERGFAAFGNWLCARGATKILYAWSKE